MTSLEERLARLEQRAEDRDVTLGKMDTKLDQLIKAAAMGKGAWILLLKLGGALAAIAYAAAWVWDHLPSKHS